MIKGIDHIAIICSDYKKSKHSYTEVLGFEIIKETLREDRNSYKLDLEVSDGVQIELFSFPHPPARVSNPEAVGLRHLAFKVEYLDEAVRKLKEKGIEFEEERIDPVTGKKFIFFRDPDDLPLELYER